MFLRNNYFYQHIHKLVRVRVDSNKWNHYFNKTLIVPEQTTEEELKNILEQSLGPLKIVSILEEKVICLVNSKEKMNFHNRSTIDNIWQDGVEFSVSVYYSRKKTAYFSIVGDFKTTESEIKRLISFLCLDAYEVNIDEIGDCWIKRE